MKGERDELVTFGGKTYRRFIPWPRPVLDGTVRCIFCGHLDEPETHDDARCPALNGDLS